jgi:hypothetical protein
MRKTDTPTYPRYSNPQELEPHYSRHVGAMTSEGLHEKADIAFQLALRDKRIAELERQLTELSHIEPKDTRRNFWCRSCRLVEVEHENKSCSQCYSGGR